jgi:alkanesulfonate monooxygenase SsuD/methylene tetrahydromethanopterin reductase-like flavin-dependent oxidoreductase (luciferase family)
MLAAELGLPYAFASHFAPEQLIPSLQIYRSRFKPSEQLDRPYAMVGVNIIVAESDAEARRLATTQQMSFVNLFRGARGLSQPATLARRRCLVFRIVPCCFPQPKIHQTRSMVP